MRCYESFLFNLKNIIIKLVFWGVFKYVKIVEDIGIPAYNLCQISRHYIIQKYFPIKINALGMQMLYTIWSHIIYQFQKLKSNVPYLFFCELVLLSWFYHILKWKPFIRYFIFVFKLMFLKLFLIYIYLNLWIIANTILGIFNFYPVFHAIFIRLLFII